ncbi:M15 family metallopeptidase [Nocardia sp. NPDC049190]|uniref:M15 family metallopeptidase n=1 Tax=Nocardia sp. NPDC049190 TaxID=3155650 RepID=UPI00340C6C8B
MVARGAGLNRMLFGLPVAVLSALVATGAMAGQAQSDPGVATDQRETAGSATGTEGLEPRLALAYTLAADEAHAQGVPLSITSGYRTPAQQQVLWDDGVATYGTPDSARRWVLPPEESTHVSGRAIDVGPQQGAAWLEANGNRWGLCRMFDNEWWHFELATIPGGACPPTRPDASVR